MKFKDQLYYVLGGVSLVPFVWLIASYIDTICHNVTDYHYAFWNLFALLF